jgi:hypothetical protein
MIIMFPAALLSSSLAVYPELDEGHTSTAVILFSNKRSEIKYSALPITRNPKPETCNS